MSDAVPGEPFDELADTKRDLRDELLQQRRSLTPDDIAAARRAVAAHVLDRCRLERWRCVAAFVPLRSEPGSVELLDGLRRLDVDVLVPVRLADNDLDWMPWPGETVLGRGAITRADVVLVPALAVAADGTRLGRGGGSYDRALARVPSGVAVVALVYDEEVRTCLPRERWDVPVTVRVTPRGGWVPLG